VAVGSSPWQGVSLPRDEAGVGLLRGGAKGESGDVSVKRGTLGKTRYSRCINLQVVL
jgi:hypothetical protein